MPFNINLLCLSSYLIECVIIRDIVMRLFNSFLLTMAVANTICYFTISRELRLTVQLNCFDRDFTAKLSALGRKNIYVSVKGIRKKFQKTFELIFSWRISVNFRVYKSLSSSYKHFRWTVMSFDGRQSLAERPNKCSIIKIMMLWFYSLWTRGVKREKRKIASQSRKFHFIWILFTVKTYKKVINHFLSGNLEFIFTVERKIFEKWRLVICYDMGNTVSNGKKIWGRDELNGICFGFQLNTVD